MASPVERHLGDAATPQPDQVGVDGELGRCDTSGGTSRRRSKRIVSPSPVA